MAEHGGLPSFVEEEFDAYLGCDSLEAGCLELECRQCGRSMLVAFSCKRRGFCTGCLGRRMSDTAVHLVQEVLPRVPIRHWVCTFPWGVRAARAPPDIARLLAKHRSAPDPPPDRPPVLLGQLALPLQ